VKDNAPMTLFRAESVQFPPCMSVFLQPSEVLALACTSHTNFKQVKKDLHSRRQVIFDRLMNYWYYDTIDYLNGNKKITIQHRYDKHYYKNVRILFQFLPELFDFIEKQGILIVDLSCLNSYGGHPECPERMLGIDDQSTIVKISEQFLSLLSKNTTLSWCNIGLFETVLNRSLVEEMIQGHPTLDHLSIRANGSTTYFNHPPKTLYRNRLCGTFYWSHFRDYEI
jgi:hypothetical protein